MNDERVPITVFLEQDEFQELKEMAEKGIVPGPIDELASALLADAICRAFFTHQRRKGKGVCV